MAKITLHIGLHRCGSTAVQSLLRANKTEFEAAGKSVLLRADIRGSDDLKYLAQLKNYIPFNPMAWGPVKQLKQAIRAWDDTIISDENLVDTMPGVGSFDFYPRLSRFLTMFQNMCDEVGHELSIVMIARRQDQLIESQYAFRVSRGYTGSFAEFMSALPIYRYSWAGLLTQLDALDLEIKCLVLEDISTEKLEWAFGSKLEGRFSGNRRDMEIKGGFSDADRVLFLDMHAKGNAEFLSDPRVNAGPDVWNF